MHEAMTGDLLYPLDSFYAQIGLPPPGAVQVDGKDVPEPYRRLLVHERDMTPTLENEYGQGIHLCLLKSRIFDDVIEREVVLVLDQAQKPVEFGAIRIQLNDLHSRARQLVVEGNAPLGAILRDQGIAHESHPKAYLRINSDNLIGSALGLTGSHVLYGRRNVLTYPFGNILADIVEILPPSGDLAGLVRGSSKA